MQSLNAKQSNFFYTLLTMGCSLLQKNSFSEALNLFYRADRTANTHLHLGLIKCVIGVTLTKLGNFQQAIRNFQTGIYELDRFPNKRLDQKIILVKLILNSAMCKLSFSQDLQASKDFSRALDIIKTSSYKDKVYLLQLSVFILLKTISIQQIMKFKTKATPVSRYQNYFMFALATCNQLVDPKRSFQILRTTAKYWDCQDRLVKLINYQHLVRLAYELGQSAKDYQRELKQLRNDQNFVNIPKSIFESNIQGRLSCARGVIRELYQLQRTVSMPEFDQNAAYLCKQALMLYIKKEIKDIQTSISLVVDPNQKRMFQNNISRLQESLHIVQSQKSIFYLQSLQNDPKISKAVDYLQNSLNTISQMHERSSVKKYFSILKFLGGRPTANFIIPSQQTFRTNQIKNKLSFGQPQYAELRSPSQSKIKKLQSRASQFQEHVQPNVHLAREQSKLEPSRSRPNSKAGQFKVQKARQQSFHSRQRQDIFQNMSSIQSCKAQDNVLFGSKSHLNYKPAVKSQTSVIRSKTPSSSSLIRKQEVKQNTIEPISMPRKDSQRVVAVRQIESNYQEELNQSRDMGPPFKLQAKTKLSKISVCRLGVKQNFQRLARLSLKVIFNGSQIMKRHLTSDGGQFKYFKVIKVKSTNNYRLVWDTKENVQKNIAKNGYFINQIVAVVYGKVSQNFYKPSNKKLQPHKCMTIYSKQRSLDLYFDDDTDLKDWVVGLSYLVKNQKKDVHFYYTAGRYHWTRAKWIANRMFIQNLKVRKFQNQVYFSMRMLGTLFFSSAPARSAILPKKEKDKKSGYRSELY